MEYVCLPVFDASRVHLDNYTVAKLSMHDFMYGGSLIILLFRHWESS